MGVYSHFVEDSAFEFDPARALHPDYKTTFLRGVQFTDSDGRVSFRTIFPGWYAGRATHLHVRVHEGRGGEESTSESTSGGSSTSVLSSSDNDDGSVYSGGTVTYTGQLFFNETILEAVALEAPYNTHTDLTRMKNADDGFWQFQHLILPELEVQFVDPEKGTQGGFATSLVLGVDSLPTLFDDDLRTDPEEVRH